MSLKESQQTDNGFVYTRVCHYLCFLFHVTITSSGKREWIKSFTMGWVALDLQEHCQEQLNQGKLWIQRENDGPNKSLFSL